MEYLDRGAWRWGFVSVIFIILRKVFFLARRRNIKHNGHRRAFFHDYSRPGLYMVTMVEVCKVALMPGDSDYERFHSLNDLAHDICIATDTRLLRIG